MQQAIYMKCRPNGVDLMPIVRKYRRVFIGYPAWLQDPEWNPRDLSKALVRIDDDDTFARALLHEECRARGYKSRITRNRHLAKSLGRDSIVVIPRLEDGVCYLGRLAGPFEFVSDPSEWACDFEDLCERKRGVRNEYQLAEAVQSWSLTEEPRSIPFSLMPKWLALLKRDAIGSIPDRPDGGRRAIDELNDLYEGRTISDLSATSDIEIVEARLMDWVGDRQLEHLVVEILQCEHPNQRWWHTGGPGDGGADAIATTLRGEVIATLQCKWQYSGPIAELAGAGLSDHFKSEPVHRYIAVLHDSKIETTSDANITFFGRRSLAELLLKHRNRIPFAQTIGLI